MNLKNLVLILVLILIVQGCSIKEYDKNSEDYDFSYVLKASGFSTDNYIKNLTKAIENATDLEVLGDYNLIIGRLTHDKEKISLALDFYSKALENADTWEKKAVLYETIASIDNSKYHYARAAYAWKRAKNKFRAKIDLYFAFGRDPGWVYSFEALPAPNIKPEVNKVMIGGSKFVLSKNDKVVSQVDRVTRDWLSYQLQNPYSEHLLRTFSERLRYSKEELLPEIGWHEGARIAELKNDGLKHEIAAGTILKKFKGKWYAPNEKGVFMFQVPIDKVLYPTTRFLRDDVALVVDTHGVNMIVSQALRKKADVVIACCDHPGKILAAKYLSDNGVKVICNTDKYVPLLLMLNTTVLGSAPFRLVDDKIVFGNKPLTFNVNEPIIVQDTVSKKYSMSYYDTPARYFSELEKRGIKLNTVFVEVNDFNQMKKVVDKARTKKANAIAVRIFNSDDYNQVKSWLEENSDHKAILFHSEAYPYGYKLAREFWQQTTFDDVNPELL